MARKILINLALLLAFSGSVFAQINPEYAVNKGISEIGLPKLFDDIDALLTDSSFSYYPSATIPPAFATRPYLVEGSNVETRLEGFKFVVAADDATDHDIVTGGGIKLYAKPNADGVIDVRQFGAEAGEDCATELQKAFSHPNQKINIPILAEPFFVESSLDVDVNEKQVIGGWIKEKAGFVLEPIVTISGDDVAIDGMKIEGAQTSPGTNISSDQNRAAILITGQRASVSRCSGSGKTTMVRTDGSYTRIIGNSFSGFGSDSNAQNQLLSIRGEYHTITGNQLHSCGAGITCGSTVNNATITGNVISEAYDNCIYVSSGVNCTVSDNACFNSYGGSAIKVRGRGNVVSANTIKNHDGIQNGPAITLTSLAAAYDDSQEAFMVRFNSGSTELRLGQILTGVTSTATGTISGVWLEDGSYDAGTATGYVVFYIRSGTYQVGEVLSTSGSASPTDVANVMELPRIGANGNVCIGNTIDGSNGYGIWVDYDTGVSTATITNVARASNIATVTTSAPHSLNIGQAITVNATSDNTFDATTTVASVPTTTTFTYSNTDSDTSSTSETGTVTATTSFRQHSPLVIGNSCNKCGRENNTGSIAMTRMFDGSLIGNSVNATGTGSLGAIVLNECHGLTMSDNVVTGEDVQLYIIKSSGVKVDGNTLRGGFTAVRTTGTLSAGINPGLSFSNNKIYGNIQTEDGNFRFSDGNELYGAIDADLTNLGTRDFFEVQRNKMIRPNAGVIACRLTIKATEAKTMERILFTDNVTNCSTTVFQIETMTLLPGEEAVLQEVKLLDLSRNTLKTNTTVNAMRILTGFQFGHVAINGGYCENRRGFLEITCEYSGSLSITDYRARNTDTGTHALCDIDGFDTVRVSGDFGDGTIANGPLSINCDGNVTVSNSVLRNLSGAGIAHGSDVVQLHWHENAVKGTTSTDVFSQLTGSTSLMSDDTLYLNAIAEQPDPPDGQAIIWLNDSGSIRIKTNFGGLVKSNVIFDFDDTTFTVIPSVSGTAYPGEVLTSTSGTATDSSGYAYQWFVNNTLVPGETTDEYTVDVLDIGLDIKCRVTSTHPNGTDPIMSNVVTCWHPIDDIPGGIVYLANEKVYSAVSPDTLAVNADRIRQWSDYSDGFLAVNSADEVTRPRWYTNIVEGNSVVQFDGQDETLSLTVGSQAYFQNKEYGYIIIACKDSAPTAGADNHRVIHWPTNATSTRFEILTRSGGANSFGVAARQLDSDTTVIATSASDGNWNVLTGEALWATGTLNLRVNGTQTATASFAGTSATSNTLSSAVRMGNGHPSATASYFPGQVAVAFAYDDELTASERSRLERYAGLLVGQDIPLE